MKKNNIYEAPSVELSSIMLDGGFATSGGKLGGVELGDIYYEDGPAW